MKLRGAIALLVLNINPSQILIIYFNFCAVTKELVVQLVSTALSNPIFVYCGFTHLPTPLLKNRVLEKLSQMGLEHVIGFFEVCDLVSP